MAIKQEQVPIKSISFEQLPPEFRKFDRTLGMPQHVFNLVFHSIIHVFGLYYFLYLIPFGYTPRSSLIPLIIYSSLTGLGITVGAHRLWSHRSFKAKMPLQILLMLMQTAALQYPIFKWARDHRVHHKYTETDADPHNIDRGFWFSHITWLYNPKHPDYLEKLQVVPIADLAQDPVVRFQSKHYWELILLVYLLVPMSMCRVLYPDMPWLHIFAGNCFRHIFSLHGTFLVNSVAHTWGDKPYDKYITSTEHKVVTFFALGEGWHNYHHTFPWDYKAAELGFKINFSTIFIHFFAWIGWAYDLKKVSHKLLVDRINRTGDGSHPLHKKNVDGNDGNRENIIPSTLWGWGDELLGKEDLEVTETLFAAKDKNF